jgi:hypothetical protein
MSTMQKQNQFYLWLKVNTLWWIQGDLGIPNQVWCTIERIVMCCLVMNNVRNECYWKSTCRSSLGSAPCSISDQNWSKIFLLISLIMNLFWIISLVGARVPLLGQITQLRGHAAGGHHSVRRHPRMWLLAATIGATLHSLVAPLLATACR